MRALLMEVKYMEGFDASKYFWQGSKVRLRPHKREDWSQKYQEFIDSDNRRLLEAGLDFPITPEEYSSHYAGSNEIREGNRLSFAIETIECEFVGWLNISRRSQERCI